MNGQETMEYTDGDRYAGSYKDNKKEGEGVLIKNEKIIEGIWKNGKK
jgi:hypothetical protein